MSKINGTKKYEADTEHLTLLSTRVNIAMKQSLSLEVTTI